MTMSEVCAVADRTELGRRVRAARERRGWSQEELGANAKVDQGTISLIERASGRRGPNAQTVVGVAEALGEPVAAYLELAGIIPALDNDAEGGDEPEVILAIMMAHAQAGPMVIRLKAEAPVEEYPALLEESLEHFAVGLGRQLRKRREEQGGE